MSFLSLCLGLSNFLSKFHILNLENLDFLLYSIQINMRNLCLLSVKNLSYLFQSRTTGLDE